MLLLTFNTYAVFLGIIWSPICYKLQVTNHSFWDNNRDILIENCEVYPPTNTHIHDLSTCHLSTFSFWQVKYFLVCPRYCFFTQWRKSTVMEKLHVVLSANDHITINYQLIDSYKFHWKMYYSPLRLILKRCLKNELMHLI